MAGVSAGMTVFGYSGTDNSDDLLELDVRPFLQDD